MNKMSVNICGIEFKNPIISASGTYNFGEEFRDYYDISILGGISVKGLTREVRQGNDSPRIAETYGGILNSVGLQNPGIDFFIDKTLGTLKNDDTVIIANIAGSTIDDYLYMAERVDNSSVDMVELNISCPNVKEGGSAFGAKPESVLKIVSAVRKVISKKPFIVKLTPNTASIVETALASQEAGADAISLINTITGMAVDVKTRKPILANIIGGLSGPAIKPVALRMVWQASSAVNIPVIGMGGIMTAEDVVEFMLCGASAVQVGTANIIDPMACKNIIEGLDKYMSANGIKDINEIIGELIV